MKIYIFVLALVLVLSARNAEALAPAPLVLITNAETSEIEWHSPSLEAMNRPVVSMYRPYHKSPEQKWYEFLYTIDALDPFRHFRIVALSFLFSFCITSGREEGKSCVMLISNLISRIFKTPGNFCCRVFLFIYKNLNKKPPHTTDSARGLKKCLEKTRAKACPRLRECRR